MKIFNITYIYLYCRRDNYFFKFMRFVKKILSSYKADLVYPFNKKESIIALPSFCNEEYNPIQLKILPANFQNLKYECTYFIVY